MFKIPTIEEILEKMGVDPAQLQAQLKAIVESAATVKREVEAGKKGFQGAMSYFDQRVNVLEHNQRLIMAKLGIPTDGENIRQISTTTTQTLNGHDTNSDA